MARTIKDIEREIEDCEYSLRNAEKVYNEMRSIAGRHGALSIMPDIGSGPAEDMARYRKKLAELYREHSELDSAKPRMKPDGERRELEKRMAEEKKKKLEEGRRRAKDEQRRRAKKEQRLIFEMIDTDATAGSLVDSGFEHVALSEWKKAEIYFCEAQKRNPEYAPAYLGLLCVDLKVPDENKLSTFKSPASIINNKYYKRAVTDPAIKAWLDGCIQTINARIDAERKAAEEAERKKRVQHAFDNACRMMSNARDPDDYRKAIAAFDSIDSNYQDINSQIKSKIFECENKKSAIEAAIRQKYGAVLDRFSAEGRAQAEERRMAAQAQLDEENAKAEAAYKAKYMPIMQSYITEDTAWEDEYSRLKASYEVAFRKWEGEVNKRKAQSEKWKSQGLCPHDGGTLKGLLAKKCILCGWEPSVPITVPSAPAPPLLPPRPPKPQIPMFTPRKLENGSSLPADVSISIEGGSVFVKLGGIKWRVLDVENNKALLISKKILEKRPYNTELGDITWEVCTLRKYLNNDFYNKLGSAKSAIAETRNSNPNNPWYGTSGGGATTDKVFLLSLGELVKYFGDSGDLNNKRRKDFSGNIKPDGYCVRDHYNNARIARGEATWWWLRSPGDNSGNAAYVHYDGYVNVAGDHVGSGNCGVRPALWLNL